MDAHVLHAFTALRSARDFRGSSAELPDTSSPIRRGATTRSAAAAASQEANELAELHAMRSYIQIAVDHIAKARASVANVFEGPEGASFRCHKCNNIAAELHILRSCEHRMCNRCLHSTFDALVVKHVQRIAPLLPSALRQPPPVITDDYLKKLAAKNATATLHCPFCSNRIKSAPFKAQMYSDLLDIARACVHIPDDSDLSPQRANIASFFNEEAEANVAVHR